MRKLKSCRTLLVCFLYPIVALSTASPAQIFKTVANFDSSNRDPRDMAFIQGPDGSLYGTTEYGGSQYENGTVFKVARNGRLATLYTFCGVGDCTDGASPCGGLVQGADGDFYGVTNFGGRYASGTIFKITAQGELTTIYSFCSQYGCPDGAGPCGPLVEGLDGNFYGTTVTGGSLPCDVGCGTVFKVTPTGNLTTLYRFCTQSDCLDGATPNNLVLGTDGSFYGTTFIEGAYCEPSCGTVFEITADGNFSTLNSFDGNDGFIVTFGLSQATDGNFYGTSALGGLYGDGNVFRVTPSGTISTVHSFQISDGFEPYAGIIQGSDGNLYGTTDEGGNYCNEQFEGCGTIFEITPNGELKTLYAFTGGYGYNPDNPLFQATNGVFYGSTVFGGSDGFGTVFSLSTGIAPFVRFVRGFGKIGQTGGILGQGFEGTTVVSINGISAPFKVLSDNYLIATVPPEATSGYVTVETPGGLLTSNVPFHVIQ